MRKTALIVSFYALLVVSGGVMGYLSKGSLPSLLGGIGMGIPLGVISLWMFKRKSVNSLYWALCLTFLLDAFFTVRTLKTGSMFPSGIMCIASLMLIFVLVMRVRRALKKVSS